MQKTCPDYMVLDIRKFPLVERNFHVIDAFESIRPHCSFLVVTDQDPVALRKEFEGELKGRFLWEITQDGPSEWRVLITALKPEERSWETNRDL